MTFGKAIEILKAGGIVRRRGWNGKGMWLVYVEGRTRKLMDKPPSPYFVGLELNCQAETYVEINPHIDIHTADGAMQPGWTPTQSDMLSGDWELIEQASPAEENQ